MRLSRLQKFVLSTAYTNRVAEERDPVEGFGADCYTAEVLAGYYGFQPTSYGRPIDAAKLRRRCGSQNLSRSAIGAAVYDTAQAATSRALARLASRGLVDVVGGRSSRWAGVNLTGEGCRVVERLGLMSEYISPNRFAGREAAA